MDNLTKLVRDEITRQYRSVRQFAFAVDIPLSTINSALHNGVGGSSFGTLITIQQMIVRSEDDIRRISQELYNLIQTGSRAQGRFSTA